MLDSLKGLRYTAFLYNNDNDSPPRPWLGLTALVFRQICAIPWQRGHGGNAGGPALYWQDRATSTAFVPPNAKEFDMTAPILTSCRARFGT